MAELRNESDIKRAINYSDEEVRHTNAAASPADEVRWHQNNIVDLRKELAAAKDPQIRKILQEEYNKLQGPTADSADTPSGMTPMFGREAPTGEAPSGMKPMFNAGAAQTPSTAPATPAEVVQGPNPAFSSSSGGAATGMERSRLFPIAPGREETVVGPTEKRTGLEASLGAAGAIGGGLTLGPPGALLFGTGGVMAGSLLSEFFDPTQHPIKEAVTGGAANLALAGLPIGSAAGFRYMLGKPSANGEHLLAIMEARGLVPPAGTVLEGSLAKNMQAIGSSDAFFGKKVQQAVMDSGNVVTDDLRNFVSAYQRYYGGAKTGFKLWDEGAKIALGKEADIVALDRGVIDKLKAAQRTWDSVGANVDFPLREMMDNLAQAEAQAGGKFVAFRANLEQAEAVRQLLHQQANALAGTARTATGQAVGKDVAQAIRSAAYKVGDDIEYAIDLAVKDGRIPVALRGVLNESREMWKQWRVGEALQNEFIDVLKLNERNGAPIASDTIYKALARIEEEGRRLHKSILSTGEIARLESMGKALQAVEASGHSTQFTMAVRAGQLFSISGGAGFGANAMAMTLVPAALGFIVRNPETAALLIRGLRLPAGSAAGLRAANQLQAVLQKEGYLAPVERKDQSADQSSSGQP